MFNDITLASNDFHQLRKQTFLNSLQDSMKLVFQKIQNKCNSALTQKVTLGNFVNSNDGLEKKI